MPRSNDPNNPWITPKMERLVDAYFLNGGNKKAAMIEAGYTQDYDTYAQKLFKFPGVVKLIEERRKSLREKFEVKFETILDRLAEIADGYKRLAKYKKVDTHGRPYWDFTGATEDDLAFITTIDSEVKFGGEDGQEILKVKIGAADIRDAKAALDSLAKLIGVDKNRVEISGPGGKPIEFNDQETGRRIAFLLTQATQENT